MLDGFHNLSQLHESHSFISIYLAFSLRNEPCSQRFYYGIWISSLATTLRQQNSTCRGRDRSIWDSFYWHGGRDHCVWFDPTRNPRSVWCQSVKRRTFNAVPPSASAILLGGGQLLSLKFKSRSKTVGNTVHGGAKRPSIQYRSEISGQRTRKTHAPFLRKRVLKNACFDTRLRAFARIWCACFLLLFTHINGIVLLLLSTKGKIKGSSYKRH